MPTLRAAAELLAAATDLDALEPIAALIGCHDAAPLDARGRADLGIDALVTEARVATGRGAIRALLATLGPNGSLRDVLPRLAARLASRAPHVLWIVIAEQPERRSLAIVAWPGDRRTPRVAALVVDRDRVVDSDAETLRALSAASDGRDVLAHARWVDVLGRESLTNRFYRALERAVDAIARSSLRGSDAARRELALLDTSRLIFLCFLEAKGWLDGDAAFLPHQFARCAERGGRFHERVLRPLFFGTLNTPLRKRSAAARRFGAVPFLNGGLFARTPLERETRGLAFSDDSYGALIHDVFAQFRFTAAEESATWTEAAVDPEMLGHAFESLMASRERQRTGAFFTPYSLVERVTASALDAVNANETQSLERLAVLDPACGSGAFLVHALERVTTALCAAGDARDPVAVRREVLTRSIFGVDVNPTAVWLCQLRLWLSVIIESTETDPTAVVPLPNLDRNIRVGDALAGPAFTSDVLDSAGAVSNKLAKLRERYARATGTRKRSLSRALDRAERGRALASLDAQQTVVAARRRDLLAARRGRDLFGGRYRPSPEEQRTAEALRREAVSLRTRRRRIALDGALPFSFPVHFADVAARGGFGLVVGNPPWVRLHRVPPEQRSVFRATYDVARFAAWEHGAGPSGAGSGFAAQVDVAALFVERSLRVAAPAAVVALLVPAKLWRSLAGGGVRRLIESEATLLRVEDYSEAPSVFDAAVYPSLVVARRLSHEPVASAWTSVGVHHHGGDTISWRARRSALPLDDSPGAPWIFLPPQARRGFDRLQAAGGPLAVSLFGRPHLGVKCGCNDAFLVDLLDVHGDEAIVLGTDGKSFAIELDLVRPLLRGDALRRWCVPPGFSSILWTHGYDGTPLDTLPPLATRWFARWRRALALRTDARDRARWWSLFRTESARCDRPRVVWGDVGREPRASVLDEDDPRVPLNSCYVARCPSLRDAHALAALLNTPLARAWLDAIAEPARGGYRRYLGWTLSLLPMPANWDRARDALAPLSEAAVAGSPPSESDLLEASLDAYSLRHDDVAPLIAWMAP